MPGKWKRFHRCFVGQKSSMQKNFKKFRLMCGNEIQGKQEMVAVAICDLDTANGPPPKTEHVSIIAKPPSVLCILIELVQRSTIRSKRQQLWKKSIITELSQAPTFAMALRLPQHCPKCSSIRNWLCKRWAALPLLSWASAAGGWLWATMRRATAQGIDISKAFCHPSQPNGCRYRSKPGSPESKLPIEPPCSGH